MLDILHLIDDAKLGGVTRGLAQMANCLGPGFQPRVQQLATTWPPAPRLQADVIIIDFTLSWAKLPFLLSLRRRHRGKLIIVEHSYTEAYEQRCVPNRTRFRTMLRLCFRLADNVVAVSRGQADWLRDAKLVDPARLVCIPQAVDTSRLLDIRPDVTRDGPLRLGAYGRFATQKGFDVLVEAMRRVAPTVATLEIAGYGETEAALRRSVADLPHVSVIGRIDGPVVFLPRVQAVVVPSRWEAYGLVAQEARAAARPVIAADLDGLAEQVGPDYGLLVPAEQPELLAAAIHDLAQRSLGPMADAARASVAGAYARKGALWRNLLLAGRRCNDDGARQGFINESLL